MIKSREDVIDDEFMALFEIFDNYLEDIRISLTPKLVKDAPQEAVNAFDEYMKKKKEYKDLGLIV